MYFIFHIVLYFPVQGHKGSPVLPRLLAGIVRGSLPRRAYFESLRAAEAKNAATINQLKYRSRSCFMENVALGAWSRVNKALGCASCFIGSRPRPRAIFPVIHSHGTLINRLNAEFTRTPEHRNAILIFKRNHVAAASQQKQVLVLLTDILQAFLTYEKKVELLMELMS